MLRTWQRVLFHLLLLTGFFVMMFGLMVGRSAIVPSFIVASTGLAMMILGIFLDNWLAHRAAKARAEKTLRRIAEMTGAPWKSDQSLVVGADNFRSFVLGVAWLTAGVAGMYSGLFMDRGSLLDFILGCTFIVGSVPMVARAFFGFAKPAFKLDTSGISTTFFGPIPWKAVSCVELKKLNVLGWAPHALVICLKDYPHLKWNFHWTEGAMAAVGLSASRFGELVIPFRDRHDTPETVEAVARHLWKQASNATMIDHPVHPARG